MAASAIRVGYLGNEYLGDIEQSIPVRTNGSVCSAVIAPDAVGRRSQELVAFIPDDAPIQSEGLLLEALQ